jgi:tetratricopeptide (TPR) repeat protein
MTKVSVGCPTNAKRSQQRFGNQLHEFFIPASQFLFSLVLVLTCFGCQKPNPGDSGQPLPPKNTSNPTGSKQTAVPGPLQELQSVGFNVEPFQVPRVENPGYLGPESCAECHKERLEECLGTSHFKTCRQPDPATMPRGFKGGSNSFALPYTEVRFEMSQRDGKYYQAAINKSALGDLKTESTIDLILGAGKSSDEVYLSWHPDDTMWELPVAWVYANDCWGASGFDRNSGGDHARALTLRCFECHNTWFEHVPGTLAEYRRDGLILGVTCERCHGPSKEHVEFHRKNPKETKSQHILLPSSLPRERLLEVCTQCHGNAIRHRGPALSYRPGEDLSTRYRWVDPPHQEDDHVANQIEYMRQSKCFQQSEMTCITCHDPHLTDQPADGDSFRSNCVGCHQPANCGKQSELAAEVQGKCTECHMRKYVKINVNFDLADDSYVPPARRSQHRIEVDPVGTNEVLLRWHRQQSDDVSRQKAIELEQQILSHWLLEAEHCASVGRFRGAIAAIREGLLIKPSSEELKTKLNEYVAGQTQLDADENAAEHADRNNQPGRARELFESVLKRNPNHAHVAGKLGTLAAKRGERELANDLLSSVTQLNPDDQYGISMLAWLAMLERNYARASELYAQADSIEPYNAMIQFRWGESLAKAGEFEQAIEHFKLALRIDPKHLDAMRALSIAAMANSQKVLAVSVAKQAVQLTEYRSMADLKSLVEILMQAGQKRQAEALIRYMLSLVNNDSRAVTDIQGWAKSLN